MRKVATSDVATPSIFLAVESPYVAHDINSQLSGLNCNCSPFGSLFELERALLEEEPDLVVLSLEFGERCGLEFCRQHSNLFTRVPVVFVAEQPTANFEKALVAIREGAADVVPVPLAEVEVGAALSRRKASREYGFDRPERCERY